MLSGVRTRAQKRRIGERDVWDLIVKCDDVCFKHIIPRLNETDVKFLYEVNSETRKLIKRSSRKGELKRRFKVSEMSSISTLEFAWEHKSLWPSWWDEPHFCSQVAQTNKLELLKWAREEKKCEWDDRTINAAADKVIWKWSSIALQMSVLSMRVRVQKLPRNGHLEVLKYLREEVKAPWDWNTASLAALNGHLHILEYLVERKYDKYSELACERGSQVRPLRLFEVLARNRQSAVGRLERILRTQEQPPRMCTIPPRQQLSSPIAIGDTRTELYTPHNKYTHKERERERKKEKHKTKLANNKI